MPDSHDDTHERAIDPRRLVIKRAQLASHASELARAARVGATPEPQTMRGAEPVTVRFRPPGAAMTQRHATWRIPADHPGAHRLEQLHVKAFLDSRLYANACALLALWIESGLGASAVADYQPRERSTGSGDAERETAEDEMRRLMAIGCVDTHAAIMLVRGDVFGGDYMFRRACRALARLDHLAARRDGEPWPNE
jgi:hypothetical protein